MLTNLDIVIAELFGIKVVELYSDKNKNLISSRYWFQSREMSIDTEYTNLGIWHSSIYKIDECIEILVIVTVTVTTMFCEAQSERRTSCEVYD